MAWERIKRTTQSNRNIVEWAIEGLVDTCDWVSPIIKQLPRGVCGSDMIAYDVREDGEYPICVFRDKHTHDWIAIPDAYVNEGTPFISAKGIELELVLTDRDYEVKEV
jgi:hypothetical protein